VRVDGARDAPRAGVVEPHLYCGADRSGAHDLARLRVKVMRRSGRLKAAVLCDTEVIEFDSLWGAQHSGVLENFAQAVLHGTPLLAPGSASIHRCGEVFNERRETEMPL